MVIWIKGFFTIALFMLVSCDNYNLDVGLSRNLIDLSENEAGHDEVVNKKKNGKGYASVNKTNLANSKIDNLKTSEMIDNKGEDNPSEIQSDINKLDSQARVTFVPSVIEAIPVKGESLLPISGDVLMVIDEGVANPVNNDLLLKNEEMSIDEGNYLVFAKKDDHKMHEKVEIKWLDSLTSGHKKTLEYFKGVLQDDRYKSRLGGMHVDRYEDNIQKYAYSDELFLNVLANIGEQNTKSMLAEIQRAREAVEKYSGAGDIEDILYELESDLSYAFYQTKIFNKKPSIEVLNEIKSFSKSFIKNINNEFVLINKKISSDTTNGKIWSDKFREYLTEKEMYTLKVCEILLKGKDISLERVDNRFILLGKDITHKTLKKLDELISSLLIKDILNVFSEKVSEEKILQRLESLSKSDKKKLDTLVDRLNYIFRCLVNMNLNSVKIYETLEDLMNQVIKEFKYNDYRIKYAYSNDFDLN
ncbi:hypothetical protein F0310_04245 (plasmid) [Borrelia sp. A-FGy1]|uniref:hypothetical protein n=1 Tax=Borrelia sp. A-FGy1 TaxID=2608247 RepID=UPI0015F3C76D|nr:hypothetical protein [Borrelia sp. A-FGy1]QMU99628.1 hypothetical protein F0310_04245 [Borrelia sp. A-FGy1]